MRIRRLGCIIAVLAAALPCRASSTRPLRPLPVAGRATSFAPGGDADRFCFVVAGDNRAAGRGVPPPPTATQVFAEVRLVRPALTLWTGDAIYGSEESLAEADSEYTDFLHQAARSETPTFNAPGNHEIFDRKEMEELYRRRMGLLYGSFDYGHSHFIALDTEEIGANGGIGKAQRDWLEEDLRTNRQASHVFVFMHHPLFPKDRRDGWSSRANRDDVHNLFVKYGVKYVYSGHEHLYFKSVHDGVIYLVSGGGGAPTDASPDDGGFQHYVVVTVDGNKVTAAILQPWRLFAYAHPPQRDGAASALVCDYNNDDVPVAVEVPSRFGAEHARVSATWTYKSQTHPLDAAIVSSSRPGFVRVRLTVPAHRAAVVTVRPN